MILSVRDRGHGNDPGSLSSKNANISLLLLHLGHHLVARVRYFSILGIVTRCVRFPNEVVCLQVQGTNGARCSGMRYERRTVRRVKKTKKTNQAERVKTRLSSARSMMQRSYRWGSW